jgi:hypothetical protein
MRKLILIVCGFLALGAWASIVVITDPSSVPQTNRVVRIILQAETLAYLGRSNAYINPPFAPGTDQTSCWVSNDTVRTISTNLLAAYAASNNNYWTLVEKTNAVNLALSFAHGTNAEQRFMRAMLLVIRQRMDQLSTNPTGNLGAITTNAVLLAISNAIVADPK